MLPAVEGKWQRYRREVREAATFLAPFAPTLAGDNHRAYCAIVAWMTNAKNTIPPEPEATRVKAEAARRKGQA